MPNHAYIPRSEREFDSWFHNLMDYVCEKTSGTPPDWTHIPAEKVAALVSHYSSWSGAFADTCEPHASAQTLAKNTARKGSERFVRPFVSQYLRFEPLSDSERVAMGVPVRKKRRAAVMYFAVGGHPVTDYRELTRRALLNRALSTTRFLEADDGKYVSAALQWGTHSNLHGPLSQIQFIKIQ